jgi:hypothetical protein
VIGGGFPTGELLAEGPLLEHERALLARLGSPAEGAPLGAPEGALRARLNAYYLTEAGMGDLLAMLRSGRYRVGLPEEGALLAVAWLLADGGAEGAEEARAILDEIAPFFPRLRFYPLPHPRPLEASASVRVQDAGATVAQLEAVRERPVALRQREAAQVWAPLCDQLVQLFLETVDESGPPRVRLDPAGRPVRRANGSYEVEGGWPCQRYPDGWGARAGQLLAELESMRRTHQACRAPERAGRTLGLLRRLAQQCRERPQSLTGREVTHLRVLLAGATHKRGLPGSDRLRRLREGQLRQVARPSTRQLAEVLVERLRPLPPDGGLPSEEAVQAVLAPPAGGRPFPTSLEMKVLRCWEAPLEGLLQRGVVTSGAALARLVPQFTAQSRAAAIDDPALRRLYGALYEAFRRRRSLLLLNLESQVRLQELPWVRPLEARRLDAAGEREQARRLLQRVVRLTLGAFPQTILPNPLLREIGALADGAGLQLPLVEELAADIFMGEFGTKFLRAAQWAATRLEGTLYARYYDLPVARIQALAGGAPARRGARISPGFGDLCRERAQEQAGAGAGSGAGAGTPGSRWSVASNGTVIEQAQVLTTHNLAVLFDSLGLEEALGPDLEPMARRCCTWAFRRLRFRPDEIWHARLIALKSCAYAWRQMVFYLSLLPPQTQGAFVEWAEAELDRQRPELRERLRPVLAGLRTALHGIPSRPFLGWTTGRHWLLT